MARTTSLSGPFIFLLDLFGKRANEGAIDAAIGFIVLPYLAKVFMPALPFMDPTGLVFLIALAGAVPLVTPAGSARDTIETREVRYATRMGSTSARSPFP